MPQVREFKIPRGLYRWKRRLKVYSRSFILYCDYSNSLTLSNVGELSWGWSRAVNPHGKEMLRKTFIKKGDAWANSGLASISSVLFTPFGEMISLLKYPLSRQMYFAYLAVFFTWVSCLTPNFGAHNYRKMSLQNSPRINKKDEMRTSCNSVSNIHWRSKHVKYN